MADVATANITSGSSISLIYVTATLTLYRYLAAGAAFTVDNTFILATGDGGASRWLAIAGQYAIHDSQYFRANTAYFRGRVTQALPAHGAEVELLLNPNFTTDLANWAAGAGWAWAAGGFARHTPGLSNNLSQGAVVIGNYYQLTVRTGVINAGHFYVTCGGATLNNIFAVTDNASIIFQATATSGVAIVPDASFDGDITSMSLVQLTPSQANIILRNQTGTDSSIHMRPGYEGCYSVYIGENSGRCEVLMAPTYNVALGHRALESIRKSVGNVAVGAFALNKVTNESSWGNVGIGEYAGTDIVQGVDNVLIGRQAGAIRSGNYNVEIGAGVGDGQYHGDYNVVVGHNAGRCSNNVGGSYNVYIGYNAGSLFNANNQLAIEPSNSVYPLIGGDFSTDQLNLNADASTINESAFVYNNTGGPIAQWTIVRLAGGAQVLPWGICNVSAITNYSQVPIGIALTAIANTARSRILRRGHFTSALDTSLSSLGARVYVTNAGALTLTKTPIEVGRVVSLAVNGELYLDFSRFQRENVRNFSTVANAEAAGGANEDLIYVAETETIYKYIAAGAAYTDDNTFVLSTSDGGNTRWIGIAGRYIADTLRVGGGFGAESISVEVYNNSGGVIAQYKVVEVTGVDGTRPTVRAITSTSNRPVGILTTSLNDTTMGYVLRQGVLQVTGFDTTLSAIGSKVYSDATGSLTLTTTSVEVGVVLTLNANGTIYLNIGGGGGGAAGAPSGEPLRIRLAAADIDGAINLINTDISLYSTPALSSTLNNSVVITNRNNATVKVRLAHVDGAIGSVVNADYIFYDGLLQPYEVKPVEVPGMAASDSILVRSDTTNVNFKISGFETPTLENLKRVAAYNIAVADTNEQVVSLGANTANLKFFICNKNASNPATIRLALIDGALGALANEDYSLYEEVITAGETRGFELEEGLSLGGTVMLRASLTDINIVLYGEEY